MRNAGLTLRTVKVRLRVEFVVELNEFILRLETRADECLRLLVLKMIRTKRILEYVQLIGEDTREVDVDLDGENVAFVRRCSFAEMSYFGDEGIFTVVVIE